MSIIYKQGCKYQLKKDYDCDTGIKGYQFRNEYMQLELDGTLFIDGGYAWDGPSGPTIDTKTFMRGSLVHDALYQLMREEHIPRTLREHADRLLRKHCREDGMSWFRAWYVYKTLRWFGAKNVLPSQRKITQRAP